MALRAGRNVDIYLNGIDVTGDLNSITPVSEQEIADVSTFGVVGHTGYPGLAKDGASIEGLYNNTESAVFQALSGSITGYACMIPFGTAVGDPAYATNETMLKSRSIKAVCTDVNRISAELDVDNYPFERGYMLTPGIQGVATGSGSGTAVDNLSNSGTTGGAVYLQVFDTTGTFTARLQVSSTGAWAGETVSTAFTAITGATTQRLAFTSQIYRYARVAYISSGGSTDFAAVLVRY